MTNATGLIKISDKRNRSPEDFLVQKGINEYDDEGTFYFSFSNNNFWSYFCTSLSQYGHKELVLLLLQQNDIACYIYSLSKHFLLGAMLSSLFLRCLLPAPTNQIDKSYLPQSHRKNYANFQQISSFTDTLDANNAHRYRGIYSMY